MEGPLNLTKDNIKGLEVDYDEVTADFLPVKLRSLFPETVIRFDLYFPTLEKGKRIVWDKVLGRNQAYTQALHDSLLKEEIHEIFIARESEEDFLEYFNEHLRRSLAAEDIPSRKKTQLLYDGAENVVKKVFRERPTRANVAMGRQFVDNFASHLLADKVSSEALFSIFAKDYGTFTHSVQVAILGMAFCRYLGWSKDEVGDFGLGALFHDIGKSAIDDAILNKPGRLDKDEFEMIRRHPALGYQRLRSARIMSESQLNVVLQHHEAFDGSGYPSGLTGEKIHKYARVARIIDCYDALTARRAYKEALPPAAAVRVMLDEMGGAFDAVYLDSFVDFLGAEDDSKDALKRVNIGLGSEMVIQPHGEEFRMKAILVGMEPGEYFILRVPSHARVQKIFREKARIVVRYLHSGTVYGFRSIVLGHVLHPLRLMITSYPRKVETLDLRKNPRIECFLPAEAKTGTGRYSGVILDLSLGGCKFMARQADRDAVSRIALNAPVAVMAQLFGDKRPELMTGFVRNIKVDEGKAELGIQFVNLNPETRQSVQNFIEGIMDIVK